MILFGDNIDVEMKGGAKGAEQLTLCADTASERVIITSLRDRLSRVFVRMERPRI